MLGKTLLGAQRSYFTGVALSRYCEALGGQMQSTKTLSLSSEGLCTFMYRLLLSLWGYLTSPRRCNSIGFPTDIAPVLLQDGFYRGCGRTKVQYSCVPPRMQLRWCRTGEYRGCGTKVQYIPARKLDQEAVRKRGFLNNGRYNIPEFSKSRCT